MAIRARLRALVSTGEIPCDDGAQTWAGQGTGELCIACVRQIPREDMEFEIVLRSGQTLFLHRRCHRMWLEECEVAAT